MPSMSISLESLRLKTVFERLTCLRVASIQLCYNSLTILQAGMK